ncbi:hypothetical protein [Litorimonas sp. WD9-15]|uniref:hypothetical protein n=1 Tax=Litorimonas sp. WD9-15 TaxID=3418716 RepID=UPI003CFE5A9A
MESEQTLKGKAIAGAKAARKADEDIGKEAVDQASGTLKKGSTVQPVYKTQEKIGGKNIHRDKDEIISEFDDPAGNTV